MDDLMSDFVNLNNTKLKIEIKRLSQGVYMFGTRKIYTRMTNGKLMVRVGGGTMSVDEFVATYAESELRKQID